MADRRAFVFRFRARVLAATGARLAILAALLYAWQADDNGLGFALAVVIAVWSITAFIWWAVRQGRTNP